MTHSLHRFGKKEDLKKDYVVMAMASKGINEEGSAYKIKKHLEICQKYNPTNLGGLKVGNLCTATAKEILTNVGDYVSTFNGVYCDCEVVKNVVQEIITEKVGLSTIISGVYEETKAIADELGFKPHTVNHSLGIWGRKELLPEPEVLEIITMCGHGMISQHLVKFYFKKVENGYDPKKAATEIGRFCYCAICNIDKVASILKKGFKNEGTKM